MDHAQENDSAHERPGRFERTAEKWIGDKAQLPAVIERNERRVERSFWRKFKRVMGRIPFSHDLLSAYYCAMDPDTPMRVRATLMGAIAYFIVPFDTLPDFLAMVGFTDDAAVLMMAITIVAAHIKPAHREKARQVLEAADDENKRG